MRRSKRGAEGSDSSVPWLVVDEGAGSGGGGERTRIKGASAPPLPVAAVASVRRAAVGLRVDVGRGSMDGWLGIFSVGCSSVATHHSTHTYINKGTDPTYHAPRDPRSAQTPGAPPPPAPNGPTPLAQTPLPPRPLLLQSCCRRRRRLLSARAGGFCNACIEGFMCT